MTTLFLRAAEPVSQAIERAQELALKKDRRQAAAVLRQAIQNSSKDSKARAKLIESLDQLSTMFFTDKGQKAFESGQSRMFDNPDMALSHLQQALALEDDNLKVLTAIAQVQIMRPDCESAQATVQRARALNPQAISATLLELRTLVCQQNFAALRGRLQSLPPLEGWESTYVKYLSAQELQRRGEIKSAFEILRKISVDQPSFPETYYFLAKVGNELNKDVEPWLRKYVLLCKGVTGRERRTYELEPRLCANVREVEDELARKTAGH
ncbi:MAG: hypothetical protein AB7P49_06620 [Bdellovibrionales bacterium]